MAAKYILSAVLSASILCLSACNNETKTETEAAVKTVVTVQSEANKTALKTRLAAYEDIFESGNIGETYTFIPPAMKAAITASTGLSEDALRINFGKQWSTALETVSMEEFTFQADAAEIQTSPTERRYALIPTTIVMGVNANPDKVIKTESSTLALMDGGIWYFARLDEPEMIDFLKYAYPDLGLIKLPEAEMKMIDRETAQ